MNYSEPRTKKYKRPKQNTQSTTNPELNKQRSRSSDDSLHGSASPPLCPLLAKDSEWVDILQTPQPEASRSAENEVEEVLQLVECEDGPGMKPLAIMFPDLVEKDPETLQGVLTKVMSTTEVTKHLVDLKQKANFTFMKQSNRLIPREKIWLESLTENTNSIGSLPSPFSSISSDYEADVETTEDESKAFKCRIKRRNNMIRTPVNPEAVELTQCIETPDLEESISSERNRSARQKPKREIKPPSLRIRKSINLKNGGQSGHDEGGHSLSTKEIINSQRRAPGTTSSENIPSSTGAKVSQSTIENDKTKQQNKDSNNA